MLIMKRHSWLLFPLFVALFVRIEIVAEAQADKAADTIYHNAKVLTLDDNFTIASAIAVKGDRVLAVGANAEVLKLKGPATKVVDLGGKSVLPGLYDSHTHPVGAATSELNEPLPYLKTLDDVFTYIRKKA